MPEKFYCEKCDYTCFKKSNWEKHLETSKHSGNKKKSKKVAVCELCDYTCCKQSLMDKHKMTNKHKLRVVEMVSSTIPSAADPQLLLSSENGTSEKLPNLLPTDFMSVISQLLNQNNELKNFIIEQAAEHKKETSDIVNKVLEQTNKVLDTVKPSNNTNTINGNVNNTQTNKFNINVFLNEQCKDAMNLSDFIKNIEVSREDLENNAQLGFVGGISKIFLDNLRQLSINERPIHCTDLKRETMYIKDDDKWTKETGPAKLNLVIQTITQKSTRTLLDWKKENPDYNDHDSEFSTRCIVIQRNSMAGHDRDTYYPKVIHAIAREVIVNK
jgi:hypothetical protein